MDDRRRSTGVLTISLDFELSWGSIGDPRLPNYLPQHRRTPGVVQRLLRLFDIYDFPVSWAIVAYLWGDVDGEDPFPQLGRLRPDIPLERVKALASETPSLLCAPHLIETIRDSPVGHEIACHSTSHIDFGQDDSDAEAVELDLRTATQIATENGHRFTSFVFPRNRVGHLPLLSRYGFQCFREPDRSRFAAWPPFLQRPLRQWEDIAALGPVTGFPELHEEAVLGLPGGLLFRRSNSSFKRHLPISGLVHRARKGIDAAIRHGEFFHLWLHPFNFAFRTEDHFRSMEAVLRYANGRRAAGQLSVGTMAEVTESWRRRSPP